MNLHMDADFQIVTISILLASVLEDHVLAVRVGILVGEELVVVESLGAPCLLDLRDLEVVKLSRVLRSG